jgi:hypothetical protein
LFTEAFCVQVEQGQASEAADRQHILNALVNLYTQSQARVAGAIAAGAWHLKRTASLQDVRSISITMEALSAEPPAEHEGYDVYNGLLQARLAAEATGIALELGGEGDACELALHLPRRITSGSS